MDRNIRILGVDDMATIRTVLQKHLEDLGFTNIDLADDGATAIPMIVQAAKADKAYDLIICDWNMPKLTPGFQTITRLKKGNNSIGPPALSRTPISHHLDA